MDVMAFEICRQELDNSWVVRLSGALYGSYLDREQALLDAVDAARDAQQSGCQAQVWLRGQTETARIL
jgi:hypothetical protein